MGKKPDFELEYVYTKSQFKKLMWWCIGIYVALRVGRIILYLTLGMAFMHSIPAAFIFFFTGFVMGILALAIYRYRRSVPVVDVEREIRRLQK